MSKIGVFNFNFNVILGNIERISELIKTVDIDIQNDVGDTALIRASEVGN